MSAGFSAWLRRVSDSLYSYLDTLLHGMDLVDDFLGLDLVPAGQRILFLLEQPRVSPWRNSRFRVSLSLLSLKQPQVFLVMCR